VRRIGHVRHGYKWRGTAVESSEDDVGRLIVLEDVLELGKVFFEGAEAAERGGWNERFFGYACDEAAEGGRGRDEGVELLGEVVGGCLYGSITSFSVL